MAEPELRDGAWWFRQPDGTLLRWDPAANAWVRPESPRPEAAATLAQSETRDPWQPLGGRARAVRALLWVIAGVSLIAAVSDAFEVELLGRIEAGEHVSDAETSFNDIRQSVIGVVQTLAFIATIVLFLMWFSRAYQNVERLGGGPLRYGRGWAIGAWFVPVLNLFRPKQIANEIWRGSDPDLPRLPGPGYWRGAPIPGLLFGLWWLLWLVTNASVGPGLWSEDTVEGLRTQSIQYLVSDVTEVGAALLCAAVVGRTTRRQEERARRVAAAAATAGA
jgi:hypothetical protein